MNLALLDELAHIGAFFGGAILVLLALDAAVETVVLPRAARVPLTNHLFRAMRGLLLPWTRTARSYQARDRVMAFYAPVSLLMLPVVWLALVLLGYAAIYWSLGVRPPIAAFTLSGSSLLTLGIASSDDPGVVPFVFSEAVLGLGLIALLIAYLPTMYAAFSRRETAVSLLEVRAGAPPTAVELLARAHRLRSLEALDTFWEQWEIWFAEVEESHTTLAPLVFFRSPKPDRSWITASGAVLDAAALLASTVDVRRTPQADLCIRAGYLALRSIADIFGISYDPDPHFGDPISISREEYDAACAALIAQRVPLKEDREQSWRDFAGWRVNYDQVLIALAALTMAPYAPWSSDRSRRRR
jgi:hypothetical protein